MSKVHPTPLYDLNAPDSLIIGIGNNCREDDGLGWAFLDFIEQESAFWGQIAYRYQLQVEDAELIRHARQVLFVDAFEGQLSEGFLWEPCLPSEDFAFTSHVLPPSAILFLCQELYQTLPQAYTLKIQGISWDWRIGLSDGAQVHLAKALAFFRSSLWDSNPRLLHAETYG